MLPRNAIYIFSKWQSEVRIFAFSTLSQMENAINQMHQRRQQQRFSEFLASSWQRKIRVATFIYVCMCVIIPLISSRFDLCAFAAWQQYDQKPRPQWQ